MTRRASDRFLPERRLPPAESRSAEEPSLRVLFTPDYTAGNPYQIFLAGALEAHGVQVRIAPSKKWLPLLRLIREHRQLDVLHVHWQEQFIARRSVFGLVARGLRLLAELSALRRIGIPTVMTVHNLVSHDSVSPSLERAFAGAASRKYEAIIVHWQGAKVDVAREYRLSLEDSRKLVMIPFGPYRRPHSRPSPECRAGGLEVSRRPGVTFLFFGLVRPYKGVLELVDAFKEVNSAEARLLVVGQPVANEFELALTAAAVGDSRISLHLRRATEPELEDFLSAADFVVLPFQRVFSTSSAVQAISYGTPVVAPHTSFTAELLGEQAGILYPSGEPGALQAALRQALAADRQALANGARQRAARLSWDRTARLTREVYLKVCKSVRDPS